MMKRMILMFVVAAVMTMLAAVPAFAGPNQVQPNQCRDSINVLSCNTVNVDADVDADVKLKK